MAKKKMTKRNSTTRPVSKKKWPGETIDVDNAIREMRSFFHRLLNLDSEARAHLIAAAPDLLASLKATLAYVADRFGIDASAEAVWKQGQAAIAKVEGRKA